MKRKPNRKGKKCPPALAAKVIRESEAGMPRIPSGFILTVTDDGLTPRVRKEIAGIPLPIDLEPAVRWYAEREFELLESALTRPPWTYAANDSEENYPDWREADIDSGGWSQIRTVLRDCIRQGFYLALLRYADELKHVPEAAAMLEANRKNAKKGGAARRKQAEPRRQQARRLDRELRKTVKKKYLRVQRIAAEMKVDTRTVERYLAPKK